MNLFICLSDGSTAKISTTFHAFSEAIVKGGFVEAYEVMLKRRISINSNHVVSFYEVK